MTLQNIFYIVGILCMSLYTLLLVLIVILLFYVKKKISDLTSNIQHMVQHPKETAQALGEAALDAAITQTAKFFSHKTKKS